MQGKDEYNDTSFARQHGLVWELASQGAQPSMPKPSVYLDTNIISAYWYEGDDVMSVARRIHTKEWWESERLHFQVRVSATTVNELKAGKFLRQADCVRMARRIARLPINKATYAVSRELLRTGMLPSSKSGDAMQMAIAAAHEVDYLLTWNYAHLCNPLAQAKLEGICQAMQFRAPLIVSPESIPQVRWGQTIRRPGCP
jgi:predicted nucleic acid-binding protein